MGEVYEAEDFQTGRIALKTIRPEIAENPEILARFRHEVQCARQVNGRNVCRIYELFLLPASARRPATAFLTMEFLKGVDTFRSHRHGRADYPLKKRKKSRCRSARVCRPFTKRKSSIAI
jgi:serine/threonine protein kinase